MWIGCSRMRSVGGDSPAASAWRQHSGPARQCESDTNLKESGGGSERLWAATERVSQRIGRGGSEWAAFFSARALSRVQAQVLFSTQRAPWASLPLQKLPTRARGDGRFVHRCRLLGGSAGVFTSCLMCVIDDTHLRGACMLGVRCACVCAPFPLLYAPIPILAYFLI